MTHKPAIIRVNVMVFRRFFFSVLLAFAASHQPAQAEDLRVEFVTAQERPVTVDLQSSGTISALDSLDLGFRQSGRVTEVLVEEGDHVTAGQPLARLDPVQQDQALNVAEASLAAAIAAKAQAQQASDRAGAMLDRGVGTRAARDAAVQALADADGSVRRAESAVDQARRAVEETVLRAPETAVVTSRDLAPGQIVAEAQPVLTLDTLDGLEAVFQMPDQPLLRAAMGSTVHLTTIDLDRPAMAGTVTDIAPLVDPTTGTVTVRARMDQTRPSTALLGAAVRGRLRIAEATGIELPWTAVMRQGRDTAVWVVDQDNRVSLAPVRISQFSDHSVFLSEGIEPGQIVVGAGSQLLYEGRKVQPAQVLP